jgi:glycosyltransferase involved in cell wall biosynthesis
MPATDGNAKLRVLTLVDGIGTFGGGERFARQLTTHLDRSRFETTFCVTRWKPMPEDGAALQDLHDNDIAVLGLERSSRIQLKPWRQLATYMREWRPDVLHSHKFGSNVWGALLAPRAGVPVFVAHEQTWSYRGKPYRRWLDRNLIARRADAFIAVSQEDRRRMIEVEGVPERLTRLLHNGIPAPPAPDPDRDMRAELGISRDEQVVGVVAVIRPQKSLDVLLRAVRLLRDDFSNLRVLIVGSGDEKEETRLQGIASQLGLSEIVSFLGARADVADLVRIFDVATLSSDFEGTPLAVMEYMEAAKPVVATGVGGVPDIVVPGETGLLVEPQDPKALAAAVAELLRDPELALRMGTAGRERRRQEFSIEAAARKVEALYEELYAAKTAKRRCMANNG